MKRNRTLEQAKRKKAQRIAARERRYNKLMQSRIVCDKRINKRHITRYRTHSKKKLRAMSNEIRPAYAVMYFGVAVWTYRRESKPIVYSATPKCELARRITLQQAIYDTTQSF